MQSKISGETFDKGNFHWESNKRSLIAVSTDHFIVMNHNFHFFFLFLADFVATVSSLSVHSCVCCALLWSMLFLFSSVSYANPGSFSLLFQFAQSLFCCFPFWCGPQQLTCPTWTTSLCAGHPHINCVKYLWLMEQRHIHYFTKLGDIFSANPHFTGSINHSTIHIFTFYCSGCIV